MACFYRYKFFISLFFFILIPRTISECSEIEHCLLCPDPENYGCEECDVGYFLDYDEYPLLCTPCHGTCKTCDDADSSYCTSCHDGYYLKKRYSSTGSCEQCPLDNCKTCKDSGSNDCTECIAGYILVDNQCKPCHSSCQECSGTEDYQCTKCPSGSFDEIPDETHHYCFLCDPNCLKCEDKQNCAECNQGFYKNSNNKCSKCDISCQSCTGGTNTDCISCKEGFYFYGKECRQCDSNCKTCEGMRNACTSCKDGFYVNENKVCMSCDENCKVCDGPGQCTTCNDGFLINKNGVCVSCGDNLHCKVCRYVSSYSNNIECLECASNAYVSHMYSDNTVSCSLCPQTCLSCHDKDYCTSCISGYYLYRDMCEKCDEGCSSCEKTPDFCTSCLSGYRLDSTNNKCIKCPEGCVDCESDEKCTSCTNGYYLDKDKCVKCDASCKTCKDGTNACTECSIGYTFNQFKLCIKCPANCTICDSTGCLDCDPEFYPLIDGTCAPCSEVCFECRGPTENDCYECDPGYYFESKLKQCIQCNEACSTCSGPRDTDCFNCSRGFWHTTRFDLEIYEDVPICGPCEYACAECTDDEICTVCNDGFRVYKGLNSPDCEACKRGCKKCDDAKDLCTECLDSFYVSSKEGNYVNCSSCPSNCKSCSTDRSNKVVCHECSDGFYLSNGKCVQCNSPCATCTSATKCTSCIAGHLFDGVNSCDAECHQDCFTCERTQTTCTSCHDGFYLVDNGCIKCPLEGCKQCVIGEHVSTCRECLDGYYKDEYFDSCYECHKSCATCTSSSDRSCLSCADGYYVKSTSGSYVSCSPCTDADANCLECHQECNSGDNCNLVCTRCVDGYSFINNQCIQCHESCQTCDGPSETDCVTCKDNYFLNSEQKCTQCSDSCVNCEGSDNKCTSCKSHYYVKNGVCEECSSNCVDCFGSSTNCTSCPSNKYYYEGNCYDTCDQVGKGYGYNSEKECVKCLIYNCLEYDETCECTKCANGYQIYTDPLTQIEICQSCGVNHCGEYDDSCQCIKCQNGYQITIDQATSQVICKTCGVDYCIDYKDECKCTKCQSGFKVTTDPITKKEICTSCNNVDNCKEFNEFCECTKCNDGYYVITDQETLSKICVEVKQDEILPGQNCGGIIKCEFDNKKDDDPTNPDPNPIVIESGSFHDVVDKDDGGAIYLSNKVLQITKSTISNCESKKKGGGIYVTLDQPIEQPIIFEQLTLSNCRASAGGAIYAYSDKPENQIKVISCKFERCKANVKPSESGSVDFGGSAIYYQVVNGLIDDCVFVNNIGNIIKVNNNFDRFSSLKLNSDEIETKTLISINKCFFDAKQLSSSAIYYLRGDKEVPFEVKECSFKGKLLNGTHYIDGVSLNKKNDKSKLKVKACKFESESNKLELVQDSFGDDLHQLNNKKSDKFNSNCMIVLSFSCISLIAIIVAIIAFINAKNENDSYSK